MARPTVALEALPRFYRRDATKGTFEDSSGKEGTFWIVGHVFAARQRRRRGREPPVARLDGLIIANCIGTARVLRFRHPLLPVVREWLLLFLILVDPEIVEDSGNSHFLQLHKSRVFSAFVEVVAFSAALVADETGVAVDLVTADGVGASLRLRMVLGHSRSALVDVYWPI